MKGTSQLNLIGADDQPASVRVRLHILPNRQASVSHYSERVRERVSLPPVPVVVIVAAVVVIVAIIVAFGAVQMSMLLLSLRSIRRSEDVCVCVRRSPKKKRPYGRRRCRC